MTQEIIDTNQNPLTVLTLLDKAMSNPDMNVDTLEKMMDLQERMMAKDAQMSFNSAMSRLQKVLPIISKTAKTNNAKYAKHEDIEAQIKPLYTAEGFSVDYTSHTKENGRIVFYGMLSHEDGHTKTAEFETSPDTSGSKNATQAIASAMTYAQRYLLKMLFNLVFLNEDDDGYAANHNYITQDQANEIITMIEATQTNVPKFLEVMNADQVTKIKAKDYLRAINGLQAKVKKIASQ